MVSWYVRGAWNLCVAGVFFMFAAIALMPPSALASEPYGHLLLNVDWSDDNEQAADSSHRKVRLSVRSVVPVTEAELTVALPATIAIKAVEPSWDNRFRAVPANENQRVIRAAMNRLDAEKWLNLEFELILPPQGGGVISFGIEGRDPGGRRIREAIGFVISDPVSSGKSRLGAVEFPATVLPPEDPR